MSKVGKTYPFHFYQGKKIVLFVDLHLNGFQKKIT